MYDDPLIFQVVESMDTLSLETQEIDLSNQGLTVLPESLITRLAQFLQLKTLDLRGNDLQTLPDSIVQLSQLEALLLGAIHDNKKYIRDGNKLSTLPDCLPQLTCLTTLDLSGNSFESVPDCITQLMNLSLLDLSNNQIRELPGDINQLNRLQILMLGSIHDEKGRYYSKGGNLLTQLPDSLSELNQLNTLDLSNNKLTTLPEVVGQLTQLKKLYLSDNQLTTLPNAVGQLTQLKELYLSNNKLTTLPNAVGQLTQLKELYLSNNKLTTLPKVIGQLTQLTTLDLERSQLTTLPDWLGQLTQLTTLDLDRNQLTTLPKVIGQLTQLKELYLSNNKLTTLPDWLGHLTQLTTLDLDHNQLTTLPKVIGQLTQLTKLYLGDNQLTTLPGWLGQLTQLQELYLYSNKLTTLPAVVGQLTQLTGLYLGADQLTTLPDWLDQLTQLTGLSLGGSQLTTLPDWLGQLAQLQELYLCSYKLTTLPDCLGQLTQLTKLYIWSYKLTTLPDWLGQLTQLQELYLYSNKLTTLPKNFGELTQLANLTIRNTQVTDLSPLSGLQKLKFLNCSDCHLISDFKAIWLKPSLDTLILYESSISGVPSEVLSKSYDDNCLERLQVYFKDLEVGEELLRDVKLIMLGNGRVGKTQICRRLRGKDYDAEEPSTHGIQITSASLSLSKEDDPLRVRIWDFGGQDIYHGTHTLFMRSQAVFVIAWTPEMENKRHHLHNGYRFRNEPLPYWVNYVHETAGMEPPVLIVQTRCDVPGDETVRPPVDDEALGHFSIAPQLLHYSALKDRKRDSLNEALREASIQLQEKNGSQYIGVGWAEVKQKLDAMRDGKRYEAEEQKHRTLWAKIMQKLKMLWNSEEDDSEVKKHHTLTLEWFSQICSTIDGVSDPDLLLSYLHDTGFVFYRPGLFDDQIILDQVWALDAIYAVLERDKCYRRLQSQKGRFTRKNLGDSIWDEQHYDVEEQKLFISMMEYCGICFEYREGNIEMGIEPEYIAPDLLPKKLSTVVNTAWDEGDKTEEAVFRYGQLLPGLMRGIISKIGAEAGLAADYWRDGVYVYEMETKSRALVELARDEEGWGGSICVRTQHGQAKLLLKSMVDLIEEQEQRFNIESHKDIIMWIRPEIREASGLVTKPQFGHEPTEKIEYFVSYARKDKIDRNREDIVDKLCGEAERRGITIIRDRTHLGLGESIPKFMQRIGEGGRVFVILSKKYLESEYCMYELFEIWRNCRLKGEEFLKLVRVYTLSSADIWAVEDVLKWIEYWEKRFEALKPKAHKLGEKIYERFRYMQEFYIHVGDILATVTSILQPRGFEELKKYGFEDPHDNE